MIGTWLLLYILGAILGGAILAWLLMGARHDSKMKRLIDVSNKDKEALKELAIEINQFKTQTKNTLALKDQEISRLRNASSTNGLTKKRDTLDDELDRELNKLKKKVSKEGENKEILSLRSELERKNRIVAETESYIQQLEENMEAAPADPAPCKKLEKKLKKYKKKLKAMENSSPDDGSSVETIEIIETIDLGKLKKLLKKGKLTKKTKKISKKKAAPKSDS